MSKEHLTIPGPLGGRAPLAALAPTRWLVPLLVLGLAPLGAGDQRKPFPGAEAGVTKRPTHGQLSERRKDTKIDRNLKPVVKPIEIGRLRSEKSDFKSESTILAFNGDWTFVPKGSVIHLPSNLADRVNVAAEGTFLQWKPFFYKNRGWLQAQNVTLKEALGDAKIAQETVNYYSTSGRIVVAVCEEGPISVGAPKGKAGTTTKTGTPEKTRSTK